MTQGSERSFSSEAGQQQRQEKIGACLTKGNAKHLLTRLVFAPVLFGLNGCGSEALRPDSPSTPAVFSNAQTGLDATEPGSLGSEQQQGSDPLVPITVHSDTVFKQKAKQSKGLAGPEKCTLKKGAQFRAKVLGIYEGHARISSASPLKGCAFSNGFLYLGHIEIPGLSGAGSVYQPLAERIASRARNQSAGVSKGQCWKYANDAVTGRGGARMGLYAAAFVRDNSAKRIREDFGLCRFVNSSGQLVRDISKAPVGSVIGYNPGYLGFHRQYGHGEVKVSANRYCSDFCTQRGAQLASFILIPCARGRYNNL